tara:strand:+ start:106 stop:627 length:522 start_codon:yes stop_codon:yes gene_type:complete
MNDSLDLRNRILKMRESNNLTSTQNVSLNNNLMSKFENSIKDDNLKKPTYEKEILSKSSKNDPDNLFKQKDKSEGKNIKSNINDNEAQFLMLANKFNEAVEVILELSHKVEKLEKNATQNTEKQKIIKGSSSFLKFKIFVFLLLIPTVIIGFFTFPFDFSIIRSIINDILSTL